MLPQDFVVLSMSELRTRPGEILDRVADRGEAFIIERNGRQKACLVPLTMFVPDVPPARIAEEINQLVEHAEEPRTAFTKNRELAFRFTHRFADQTEVELEIVLPHGYPNSCPRVYANPISDTPPHRWSDGALCIFGVMTVWNPGKHTVLSTLNLARQWLQNYESWRQSHEWPKQEGLTDE